MLAWNTNYYQALSGGHIITGAVNSVTYGASGRFRRAEILILDNNKVGVTWDIFHPNNSLLLILQLCVKTGAFFFIP